MTLERRRETKEEWALRQAPILCGCGCGGFIRLTSNHKKSRIPRFLHGHGGGKARPWLKSEMKLLCACGCGGTILLTSQHSWSRIPRFLRGHSSKTGFERWAAEHKGKHHCLCGCGLAFEPSQRHRREGFPGCLPGHNMRLSRRVSTTVATWVAMQQNRHFCECGCGKAIRISPVYRTKGIPKFRRECQGRIRAGSNHPSWIEDRSTCGRFGQDFFG